MAKQRNELISQRIVEEPLAISQPIDTNELAESMAQVSLKEREFSISSREEPAREIKQAKARKD